MGDAEVGQLGPSHDIARAVRDQNVGWLDVAVDHALPMGVIERLTEADPDLDDLPVR
jgi:hypothetical protein